MESPFTPSMPSTPSSPCIPRTYPALMVVPELMKRMRLPFSSIFASTMDAGSAAGSFVAQPASVVASSTKTNRNASRLLMEFSSPFFCGCFVLMVFQYYRKIIILRKAETTMPHLKANYSYSNLNFSTILILFHSFISKSIEKVDSLTSPDGKVKITFPDSVTPSSILSTGLKFTSKFLTI